MKTLKILYLEDSKQDAEITARTLKKAGIPFHFELVDNQREYEFALSQSKPDLVLADHSLYHFNSREALKIFKSFDFKIPFILVTGTVSEEFAVNILKEGANDYLLKDNLARLPNAIMNSLEKFKIEEERILHLENVIASESLLKETEQIAHIGSWDVDLITGVTRWSDEVYRIYGYEPGEFKPDQNEFKKHIHPVELELVEQSLNIALLSHSLFEKEFRIVTKTGQVKHVNFTMVIERNKEEEPVRLVGFNHDITQIKEAQLKMLESFKEVAKLEQELAKQKLQQQKLITEVTIEAQEKERNELGKELHDNINQILSTVKMYLGLHLAKAETSIDLIKTSHTYLSDAIEEIRKLSKTLITPTLRGIGLEEALQDLKEEVEMISDTKIDLVYAIRKHELNENLKLMLYRIVQEQLNNIFKHAKATEVIISLKKENNKIILCITDNGVGFDTTTKVKGIGLKNILSRVQFYAGTFAIESCVGKGCCLIITIPYEE